MCGGYERVVGCVCVCAFNMYSVCTLIPGLSHPRMVPNSTGACLCFFCEVEQVLMPA